MMAFFQSDNRDVQSYSCLVVGSGTFLENSRWKFPLLDPFLSWLIVQKTARDTWCRDLLLGMVSHPGTYTCPFQEKQSSDSPYTSPILQGPTSGFAVVSKTDFVQVSPLRTSKRLPATLEDNWPVGLCFLKAWTADGNELENFSWQIKRSRSTQLMKN